MKAKLKTLIFSALLILILADFTKTDVNDSLESALLVSGLCFDVTEDGKYETSFLYSQQQSDSVQTSYKALTTKGNSIGECISYIESNTESTLFFGQTDVVFISEKALKDENIYRNITDYLERNTSIGYSVHIYCVKNNMKEFLSKLSSKDEKLSRFLDSIIMKEPATAGLGVTLSETVSTYEHYIIPLMDLSHDTFSAGMVAMQANSFVAEFDNSIIRPYAMLTETEGEYYYSTELGEFYIDRAKRRYHYDGQLNFTVDIDIYFSSLLLYEYHSLQGKMIDEVEYLMSEAVKNDCLDAIAKMQDKNSDIIGINLYMHRFHHRENARLNEEKINLPQNAEFTVNVNAHFLNNGIMY